MSGGLLLSEDIFYKIEPIKLKVIHPSPAARSN